jgi:hypothetical protein
MLKKLKEVLSPIRLILYDGDQKGSDQVVEEGSIFEEDLSKDNCCIHARLD